MKLNELQKQLDEIKYFDSEKQKKDMCGEYSFCNECNKKNKYPCASAYKKFIKRNSVK